MTIYHYRVRGTDLSGLDPRAPAGPWLEIEAESFVDARRILAETSARTGALYECREALDDHDDQEEAAP